MSWSRTLRAWKLSWCRQPRYKHFAVAQSKEIWRLPLLLCTAWQQDMRTFSRCLILGNGTHRKMARTRSRYKWVRSRTRCPWVVSRKVTSFCVCRKLQSSTNSEADTARIRPFRKWTSGGQRIVGSRQHCWKIPCKALLNRLQYQFSLSPSCSVSRQHSACQLQDVSFESHLPMIHLYAYSAMAKRKVNGGPWWSGQW